MSRRNIKDEAKVNVDEIAFIADQDVAIVAILDLEDVTDDTVGSLTFDEVLTRHLVVHGVGQSKFVDEVLVKRAAIGLAHLVTTHGVGNNFDNAAYVEHLARAIGDGLVGEDVEIETDAFKDALEHLDDLKGEVVLSNVVKHLEDAGFELDSLILFFGRLLAVESLIDFYDLVYSIRPSSANFLRWTLSTTTTSSAD